jgi:hypothetical protein
MADRSTTTGIHSLNSTVGIGNHGFPPLHTPSEGGDMRVPNAEPWGRQGSTLHWVGNELLNSGPIGLLARTAVGNQCFRPLIFDAYGNCVLSRS